MTLRIYIGWDSRQQRAFDVCAASLRRRSSVPLEITALKQPELRQQKLYWRAEDPLATTEFTYTRFLVPLLSGWKGWSLFVDSDFLFTADVAQLFRHCDDRFAAMCVQHDHRPSETIKMDGRPQSVYPRKNWSSLVLWNAAHPANKILSAETVNSQTGAFLHRFQWLKDSEIGSLPATWNWLEGWSPKPEKGVPSAIHYTRGGPWYPEWQNVEYADLWIRESAS